jgi:hypothetical protein
MWHSYVFIYLHTSHQFLVLLLYHLDYLMTYPWFLLHHKTVYSLAWGHYQQLHHLYMGHPIVKCKLENSRGGEVGEGQSVNAAPLQCLIICGVTCLGFSQKPSSGIVQVFAEERLHLDLNHTVC